MAVKRLRYTRLFAGVVLAATLLGGCAARQSASLANDKPADMKVSAQVAGVPFYPQQDFQCGPASLAMAMNHAGVAVTPESLRSSLFIPGRQGSLQVEMKALPRSYGLMAYPLKPQLASILKEIEAGHPVVVFQNLGLSFAPQWHYAVVTAYDLGSKSISLHSGDIPGYTIPLSTFERTWVRAGSWAMVVATAGSLPAGAEEGAYLRAAVALERSGKNSAAMKAYEAATKQWPESLAAHIGLGNIRYAQGDLQGAAMAFSAATKTHPDAAQPLNNLAQVYLEQGHFEEAMRAIEQAVRIDDSSTLYRQTMAEIENARNAVN
ncbi:Tetratricopeptide repeat-containing protein [Mariprofundus ferrinatatus]|uniref:Tetratricopeptide repeat-containing protein n=1 Tax=Mariprofundus ferrinatatus TaxID=1921087 RepID=A0A2K8L8R7_9PROT|nr:PA2778 family cysteine peptidase [Mariprofundus ferrinatatus]ATX82629.1 Tetratricopeptide repeat-containing protein [Mariprofundus ferrinatatus]